MSLYNFLELPPAKLRYVYQLICEFDLACNLLAKQVEESTISQVRLDQITEGWAKSHRFVTVGKGSIAQTLAETQGQEFLELNSYTQMFVFSYQNAVESAKDWLIEVMRLPLWAVTQEVDEKAAAVAVEQTDEEIAMFFRQGSEGLATMRPTQMEAIAA